MIISVSVILIALTAVSEADKRAAVASCLETFGLLFVSQSAVCPNSLSSIASDWLEAAV